MRRGFLGLRSTGPVGHPPGLVVVCVFSLVGCSRAPTDRRVFLCLVSRGEVAAGGVAESIVDVEHVVSRAVLFVPLFLSCRGPNGRTDGRTALPQVYVQKVSPQKTPMVVGKLLDLDAPEDFIRNLLNSVGHQCPVDELVEQVRQKGRNLPDRHLA